MLARPYRLRAAARRRARRRGGTRRAARVGRRQPKVPHRALIDQSRKGEQRLLLREPIRALQQPGECDVRVVPRGLAAGTL